MSDVDLFGLRREALQQGLNRPRFAIASGIPEQTCGLFGTPLAQESRIEVLLEFQAAPRNTRGISGLAGWPPVGVSCFELGFRIPGFTVLESTFF